MADEAAGGGAAEGAEGEGPLDMQALLDEVVERNRHVSGMLLVQRDGGEAEEDLAPLASGVAPLPDAAAAAALNHSFDEGGAQGSEGLELGGRRMAVAERREVGEFYVVVLSEGGQVPVGPSTTAGAGEAPDFSAADFLGGASVGGLAEGPTIAIAPGAFLCPTRKWVLAVAHDAGMDTSFTLQVCTSIAEYLASEGE
mmetsp:Transcript_98646/g.283533  ORF Transcript_98646/g.283533 Transcript_98646/m.283533 type:complete len:198 (-) Transcript_98646:9-602(-)